MTGPGPRAGRCAQLSFHMHVGVCERAGYRNGAADVLDRIAKALEAGEDVAEVLAELRVAWHVDWAAKLPAETPEDSAAIVDQNLRAMGSAGLEAEAAS